MDDFELMCEIALRAMEECGVDEDDVMGAREAGYDALLDFDVSIERKREAVAMAVNQDFVDLF
jgi:hypothetical protein